MTQGSGRIAPRRGLFGWCLYDWANSAFPTVITTFVFSAYFTSAIAADKISGTAQWGIAISLSGLFVALLSPFLGAIADHGGRRKPWVFVLTLLCVVASALLWLARPETNFIILALSLAALANFAFEMAMVFYNAMLPDLVPRQRIGRLSGWGWGLGYAGGLVCLGLILVLLVQAETPIFGLDKESFEHIRATGPMVAIWMAVFAAPFFLWTPDRPDQGISFATSLKRGIATLIDTFRRVREYSQIVRFLIARMMYTEGLNTLFTFGGIYAAGTFGMEQAEVIQLGIGMSVTAGLGAFAMAWVDDWIGPKRTILISLLGLIVFGFAIVSVTDKALFWTFALGIGLFVGPGPAAGRSLMAHLAPDHLRTEMFGFMALAGKATAFVGPAAVAWATSMAESQRHGMATIIAFFVVGFILILRVPDARR